MVKKIVQKEVSICDVCGKEAYVHTCLGCGMDFCWDCSKKDGITYEHAVYFSGTGDGFFCHKCDANPPKKIEKLHQAYRRIRVLREEQEIWYSDFELRMREAESILADILESA